jgi:trehalose/maltose hydrolase-like predicted phosphorylase
MAASARLVTLAVAVVLVAFSPTSVAEAPATSAAPASDPFVMTATSYTSGYSPAYVGNGDVGTRIPAQGMSHVAASTVPTTTIVAGVWQQAPGQEVVSAAPLPGWDELTLRVPGCAAYQFTLRSVLPFVQPPYDQFTEARNGQGTFTFLTGEGGFLQAFLYGRGGFRWRGDRIHLDPTLPDQWATQGLTLRRLSYQGRTFTVSIGAAATTVTLDYGPSVLVEGPKKTATLSPGGSVTLPTRRLPTAGCA